jgi:hypothetical protein
LYDHQKVGIEAICRWDDPRVGRVVPGCFFLADEQGAGKTRQAIEAAQRLYLEGTIDRVMVVCPAPVRPVWYDPDLGQLSEYLTVPSRVFEYRQKIRSWERDTEGNTKPLDVIVSNYEFLRRPDRLALLLDRADAGTFLILDESSAVKGHQSQQTKAMLNLRRQCGRVLLMNGTPVGDNPGDLYAQARIMGDDILGCKSWFQFRARYAVLGGFKGRAIVDWVNLEDLSARMKPYVMRRLKDDCMDLPPRLPPVALEVPLTPATWRVYKEMKAETIAFLESGGVAVAAQAGVRVMRLAQITSGFLGGVQDPDDPGDVRTEEISSEKLDWLLGWIREQRATDPNLKLIVWSRFRAEVQRTAEAIRTTFPGPCLPLWGGQPREERSAALRLLAPGHAPAGPASVVGITATGSMGLNMAASHTVLYLSNDHRRMIRSQSMERPHRAGQTHPVSYFDCVATGPEGQKTVCHIIQKALRRKEDTATWTTRDWVTALKEE